jgi:hypothetical protein
VNRKVGPYHLVAPLGQGAMGSVFRARHERLGVEHALKLLDECDPKRVARLDREAKALAQVHSPHVVGVHQAGVESGRPWIALDLVEGEPLSEVVARGKPTPGRALEIALGVCRGVAALHAAGIVHRDLKPGNVVLRRDGTPVVIDLGLALLGGEAERLTRSGAMVGTLAYMAPEQVTGAREAQGPPTDVCALGLLLYQLATGQPPYALEGMGFVEAVRAIARDAPPPPSTIDPNIPKSFDRVVAKATARDPAKRYPDAGVMALELELLLEGEPQAAPRQGPPLALVLGGVGLLTLVAVAGGLASGGGAPAKELGSSVTTAPPPTAAPPPVPSGPPPGVAEVEQALAPWRADAGRWVRPRLAGFARDAAVPVPALEQLSGRAGVEQALALARATERLAAAAAVGPRGLRTDALAALDEVDAVLAEGALAPAWADLVGLEAARLNFDRGRFGRARAQATAVVEGGRGRPALEARFVASMVALWLNEHSDRNASLLALAKDDPAGPTGLKAAAAAARFDYQVDDPATRASQAVQASRRAVAADGDDVEAATTLAYALMDWTLNTKMQEGGFGSTARTWAAEAQRTLERVIERVPDHARAHLGLSTVLLEAKQLDGAMKEVIDTVALLGVDVPQDDIADHAARLVNEEPARRRTLERLMERLPTAEKDWLRARLARPR